jgi:hypothetical protein
LRNESSPYSRKKMHPYNLTIEEIQQVSGGATVTGEGTVSNWGAEIGALPPEPPYTSNYVGEEGGGIPPLL